jgi:hypothetical protein
MDNRKPMSFDQRFLAPLKNRPDLEPEEDFVEELRHKILREESVKKAQDKMQWRWPALVPMIMAVMLFSVLAASFIGQSSSNLKKEGDDTAKTTDINEDKDNDKQSETADRDINKITADNPALLNIYRAASKITGTTAIGQQLVFYFDALQKGDADYLKEILLNEDYQQPEGDVIEYYKNTDFSTIALESISQEDDVFHVIYSYTNSKTGELVRRRILVNNGNSNATYIFDGVPAVPINKEKDQLVKEKVEFLMKTFKTGMTEESAKDLFGSNYKVVTELESEDASVKLWEYHYFEEPDTVRAVEYDSILDLPNLMKQKIGIIFTISWTDNEKALKADIFYTQNGKFLTKGILADGTFYQREQKTGEIAYNVSKFELTEEENTVYQKFKMSHDPEALRNLSPLSIAKLYVQAGLDGDAETEYAFYTTDPDYIRWSKEEHLQFAKNDNTSNEQLLEALGGIQDGEWKATSDFEGYISFETKNGPQGFQMRKDADGIWKVHFMPIQ